MHFPTKPLFCAPIKWFPMELCDTGWAEETRMMEIPGLENCMIITLAVLIQETQLSLTNRATRLEILTFENYRDLQIGVGVTEGHWKCHHSHATSY